MSRRVLIPVVSMLAVFAVAVQVRAFFDQIDQLKQELAGWQSAHAADFSDLMTTLNNLSGPTFNDVSSTDWFSPYVASVSGWGVVSGYKDAQGNPTGQYGPGNNVTVAEMLKMAFKAAHTDTTTCGAVPPLHSTALGHWAQAFVSCGEQMNVRVLKDPNVDLNRPVTRAEVLAILDDVFGENVPPLYSNFKDTQGHPLESDIAFAYLNGVVSGDTNSQGADTGTFRPNDPINRAEVAKIVYEWEKWQVKNGVAVQS